MLKKPLKKALLITAAVGLATSLLRAQSNTNLITMNLVTVGDTNNVADPDTGLGAVAYPYQIGTYDVTVAQYCAFLNAVAKQGDKFNLFNPAMSNSPTAAEITCTHNSDGTDSYAPIKGCDQLPIVNVNLYSALRFCNWLHNGQPQDGVEGMATTESGAYTFSYDGDGNILSINPQSNPLYYLPNQNEWYKAAYYQTATGDLAASYWSFPTGNDIPLNTIGASNGANYVALGGPNNMFCYTKSAAPYLTPVGAFATSTGPWQTFDMGGDVCQWTISAYNMTVNNNTTLYFAALGGSWRSLGGVLARHPLNIYDIYNPSQETDCIGFRVAAPVPADPSSN